MTNIDAIEKAWTESLAQSDVDPDLAYAKEVFFNKPDEEVMHGFAQNVIERTNELRVMPTILFNHYFTHFLTYMLEQQHDEFDASEIADCFTTLLMEKLDQHAFTDKDLVLRAKHAIEHLSNNIDFYNSDIDIYGDLTAKLSLISEKIALVAN